VLAFTAVQYSSHPWGYRGLASINFLHHRRLTDRNCKNSDLSLIYIFKNG
jgi:hypothetical protein